ncbi:MAG TPA: site-specific integrase [Chloroflexi bacterium]|nr:site-specific integrase [Chloroflexota bacterium]
MPRGIKAAGNRVGVKVSPHRLRHTAATQLLNAGCRVTSIQALLGHKSLNTTMTYARVYGRTVADDYYLAMEQVERRLDVTEDSTDMQAVRRCRACTPSPPHSPSAAAGRPGRCNQTDTGPRPSARPSAGWRNRRHIWPYRPG